MRQKQRAAYNALHSLASNVKFGSPENETSDAIETIADWLQYQLNDANEARIVMLAKFLAGEPDARAMTCNVPHGDWTGPHARTSLCPGKEVTG